jgi:hypothetical protein
MPKKAKGKGSKKDDFDDDVATTEENAEVSEEPEAGEPAVKTKSGKKKKSKLDKLRDDFGGDAEDDITDNMDDLSLNDTGRSKKGKKKGAGDRVKKKEDLKPWERDWEDDQDEKAEENVICDRDAGPIEEEKGMADEESPEREGTGNRPSYDYVDDSDEDGLLLYSATIADWLTKE